jgi:hypothetical protein
MLAAPSNTVAWVTGKALNYERRWLALFAHEPDIAIFQAWLGFDCTRAW